MSGLLRVGKISGESCAAERSALVILPTLRVDSAVERGFELGILPRPHGRAAPRRAAQGVTKIPGGSVRTRGNAMTTTGAARGRGRRAVLIEQNRGDDAAP